MNDLPLPECKWGYTDQQLRSILGNRYSEFMGWMSGQTIAGCDARQYNHSTQEYEPSGCDKPHGLVTYSNDLSGFLKGRPIID